MNKTAIKNYAIWARVNLIEAAKQRAYQYEITKDNITDAGADVVSGKPLTKEEKEQRRQLIDQINRKGFDQVMEEVAYTWFNRFIALRFMEVNGYLPSKIRVFTDSEGNFKPEILKEALTVELPVDKSRVIELLEKQDNEELYKMLLIAQCNELSNGLPDMFEVISNYTELLFPNNLLKEDSILGEMVNTIPEEDWTDAVQIIGWLYQYYNSELKDETFALLKKNVKISKERIPAATQLFTPDWIVRYMVENSLGRLWYEGHHNDEIKKEWKYYLDEAPQEPEVEEQLKTIREEYKTIKPEDIKVIDPCMGSGHILVYAFDVLMQIYTSAGWSERDAAESILENNLYGLDIDDRAGQLAYFAVMMKARKYSRRILTKNIRPKVYSIQESNDVKIEAWWRLGPEEDIARRLVQDLTDAKEYGSILNLSVSTSELQALRKRLADIEEMSDQGNLLDVIQSDEITRQLYPLVELAEVMVQKYDIVVTNPPYMGGGNMGVKLYDRVVNDFEPFKQDLYCVFVKKAYDYANSRGYQAMITQQSFMFNSRFEKMRKWLIESCDLSSLVYLDTGAFEEISGEKVRTCSFIFKWKTNDEYKTKFIDLEEAEGANDKEVLYLKSLSSNRNNVYLASASSFTNIEGLCFSYWLSDHVMSLLSSKERVGNYAETRHGLVTGNGDLFMRLWHEVVFSSICMNALSDYKWYPYNKGGSFKRWYGNREYIVNWENDGLQIRNYKDDYGNTKSSNYNDGYNLRENITWSDIRSGKIAFRYTPAGALFDTSGPSMFITAAEKTYSLLGFLNSCVMQELIEIFCTGLHYSTGAVADVPITGLSSVDIDDVVLECIDISQHDWDSTETSWDFKKNPLI